MLDDDIVYGAEKKQVSKKYSLYSSSCRLAEKWILMKCKISEYHFLNEMINPRLRQIGLVHLKKITKEYVLGTDRKP